MELHDEALAEMVQQIGMKLLGAEIMAGLNKLNLLRVNFNNQATGEECARRDSPGTARLRDHHCFKTSARCLGNLNLLLSYSP